MQSELVTEAWDRAWRDYAEARQPNDPLLGNITVGLGIHLGTVISGGVDPDANDIYSDEYSDEYG